MKSALGLLTIVLLCTSSCLVAELNQTELSGVKGFCVDSPAGKGGKVLRVTTLDSEETVSHYSWQSV